MPSATEEENSVLQAPEENIIAKDLPDTPTFTYQLPEEQPAEQTPPPHEEQNNPPAQTEDEDDFLFSAPEESAILSILSGGDEKKEEGSFTGKALLQGLNKITAKAYSFEAVIDTPVTFGSLEITLKKCWKSPPEDMPENKALLEIREKKTGDEISSIFYGWMFSSSPAVSALEHPVYDITVLSCIKETSTPDTVPTPPSDAVTPGVKK